MKWLLVVVMLSPQGDRAQEGDVYRKLAECEAEARKLATQVEGLEWRRADDPAPTADKPVFRSVVRCRPVPDDYTPGQLSR